MTQHATERKVRLAAAGLSDQLVSRLAAHTEYIAKQLNSDTAVHVLTLGKQGWAQEETADGTRVSNGDMVVAIIRGRCVVTVMLRRSNQPFTPDALRVEQTMHITLKEGK